MAFQAASLSLEDFPDVLFCEVGGGRTVKYHIHTWIRPFPVYPLELGEHTPVEHSAAYDEQRVARHFRHFHSVGDYVDRWGIEEYVVVSVAQCVDEQLQPSVLQQFCRVGGDASGWNYVEPFYDAVFEDYRFGGACPVQIAGESCAWLADVAAHRGSAYVGVDYQRLFTSVGSTCRKVGKDECFPAARGEGCNYRDGRCVGVCRNMVKIVA